MEEDIEPTDAEITAEPMLQVFRYKHLRDDLRDVSYKFCQLAKDIVAMLPRNAERTVSLRKLRESKDCAVTARLWNK